MEGLVEEVFHLLVVILSPLEGNESESALDVPWSDFRDQVLVEVSSLLNIALLFLEHGVLDGQLNDVARVVSTDACLTVLKLGSDQGHVLQASLDEVYIVQPELQVRVEGQQGSLIEDSSSLELLLVGLERDVSEPGLLLHLKALLPLVDDLEGVLEGLALRNDCLRLGVEVSDHELLERWNAWFFHVRLYRK